jgi:chemotaxis protein MotC
LRLRTSTSVCLLIGLLCGPALADDAKSLVQSSRDLDRAHTAMTHGDAASIAAQTRILTEMASRIAALDPKSTIDEQQTHAIVSYLLSGGPPEPVIDLVKSNRLPQSDDHLVRGTLAYVLGRRNDAATLLAGIDPMTLDLSIAGEIAFARSVLEDPNDKDKGMRLLDEARLLSPGGLVEEAALRRQVVQSAKQGDVARFQLLSRQYLERFQASLYAPEFMKKIAIAIGAYDLVRDSASLTRLSFVLRWYPPLEATHILLDIARAAALGGRLELADNAAQRVLTSPSSDEAMKRRARLFQGSAKTLGASHDEGTAELNQIDPAMLSASDRELLVAAQETARRVHQFPDIPTSMISPTNAGSATIDAARAALADAQTVLAEN